MRRIVYEMKNDMKTGISLHAFFLPIVIIGVMILIPSINANAEELNKTNVTDKDIQEKSGQLSSVQPVSGITMEGFYYSDRSKQPYCFANAEGRCLQNEFQLLTDIEGKANYSDKFRAYYRAEMNDDGDVRLKKAYGVLRTGILSWEVGKDTVWMGPGYHGSFLLSDNAEGFLLARVKTEEPFRLPWLLSNLGEFKYDLFHGWSQNFKVLGHRLSWRPMPLFEFGANQVVYYASNKHYSLSEYPGVLFSSTDNSGDRSNPYDNDQKASFDIALDMPFLSAIPPLKTGRIYAEYGGNDSFAAWQNEDKATFKTMWDRQDTKYVWPIGLDFLEIGWLAGLFLTTGDVDLRVEYAQNFTSYPLFYDLYDEYNANRRQGNWYTDMNTRDGMITGHHMGNNADDLFFELVYRKNPFTISINYDQERRGISDKNSTTDNPPEYRTQYGLKPSYKIGRYTLFSDLIYIHRRNVDSSSNALNVTVQPGARVDDYIVGIGVSINL